MVRKFRKAVYASQSKRQELWERVIELCERKKEPTASEVKSVLPAQRYNAYVKSLRTFKKARIAEARPIEIDYFMSERKSIRAKRKRDSLGQIRSWWVPDKLLQSKWENLHAKLAEQCAEKPELCQWIIEEEGGISMSPSERIVGQDLDGSSMLSFHTVASYNRQFKGHTIDSAERAAVLDYYHSLQKEFRGTDEWDEVEQFRANRFGNRDHKNKDFSGIKY